MTSLDDVYRKFGETAEAAQLLETELGNMLLMIKGLEENLILEPNPDLALSIYKKINKSTLGQLLKQIGKSTNSIDEMLSMLERAQKERNRLSHSFYKEHNFRRNTNEGRSIMLEDLNNIHDLLLDAYKAVLRISGIDLDDDTDMPLPTKHLNL